MKAAGALLFGIATLSFAAAPVEVKVTRPARGEIIRYVTLPGSIRANQQATLYAKVPGYLKSIAVDRGDTVKAGQMLAEIEVPELSADLAKYQAEIAKAKAEVDIAALEFDRLARAQNKSADLVVPQTVDNAKARLAVVKASLAVAEANWERTETLLSFTKITAPFAGVVTARFVDAGAFIPAATSGSAAQTAAMVTIMDFNRVRAQVGVPELEAPLVREGQPVKVSVEGLPGRPPFEGTVSRQSFALDDATRTMLVEADLQNDRLELRPGMYATVKVGVEKHADTLTIPAEALVMEKANAFLFLLTDGKAKKTPVKIGFNDGERVEILSGATAEARVLLAGKMTLADGQSVNALEAK